MSEPQTKSELPKKGARTRLAAISTPSRTARETKPAVMIAAPSKRARTPGPGPRSSSGPRPLPSRPSAPGSSPGARLLAASFGSTHELLEGGGEVGITCEAVDEDRVHAGPLQ